MPAAKRSYSDTDSLASITPPSSPTGPKTPLTKPGVTPGIADSDDDSVEEYVPKKARKASSNSALKAKKTKLDPNGGQDQGEHGVMTPEKKEGIIADVIAAGLKALTHELLAAKYGLTKGQVKNAMQAGRSNLREKVIKAARDC